MAAEMVKEYLLQFLLFNFTNRFGIYVNLRKMLCYAIKALFRVAVGSRVFEFFESRAFKK